MSYKKGTAGGGRLYMRPWPLASRRGLSEQGSLSGVRDGVY